MPLTIEQVKTKYKGVHKKPVVSMARDAGIEVYDTPDLTAEESGSISLENGQFVIYVNENHPMTRRRFTIAHELGHFAHDQDFLQQKKEIVSPTWQPMGETNNKSGKKMNRKDGVLLDNDMRSRETRANRFAADLLMPEDEFRQVWQEKNSIEEVAEEFGVSVPAATFRALNLRLLTTF